MAKKITKINLYLGNPFYYFYHDFLPAGDDTAAVLWSFFEAAVFASPVKYCVHSIMKTL